MRRGIPLPDRQKRPVRPPPEGWLDDTFGGDEKRKLIGYSKVPTKKPKERTDESESSVSLV